MMNRYLLFLAVSAFFSTICPCHAAVIERDWLNEGDGLLTFDTVNQREWLDVPVTRLSEYPGELSGVIADLEPGRPLQDFTWATSDDVFALAESAGIDTGTNNFNTNSVPAGVLADLLGRTTSKSSLGFINELNDQGEFDSVAGPTNFDLTIGDGPFAGFFVGSFEVVFEGIDFPGAHVGVMLYRNVPEPTSCLMVVLGMLWLLGIHRLPMIARSDQ